MGTRAMYFGGLIFASLWIITVKIIVPPRPDGSTLITIFIGLFFAGILGAFIGEKISIKMRKRR